MSPSRPEHRPAVDTALSESQRVLDFAVRWYRFGGGSAEDIYVTFGLDRATFGRRVLAAVGKFSGRIDPTLELGLRTTYGS